MEAMTRNHNPPLVTVLLPVRNGAAHLADAVDSILQQTFSDFELLVVDDASEDDTPRILSGIRDSRLRVLTNPQHLRLAGALNRGIAEAKGEYLARMDADDVAHHRRIEKQVRFMQEHLDTAICGTWVRRTSVRRSEILRYPTAPEEVKAFALFNCPFAHPTVMVRLAALRDQSTLYDVGYYPTEDFELWSRLLDRCAGANLPEPLLEYRVREDSMTGADWENMDRQAARILQTQLYKLGIEADAEEAAFHRAVAMRRPLISSTELRKAESWLLQIIEANSAARYADPYALQAVIADIWFELCMHMKRSSAETLRTHWASSLRGTGAASIRRQAVLTLSFLKRSLFIPQTQAADRLV